MNLKSDATSAEIIDYLFTLKELHLFDIFFNSRVELLEPTIIENLLQHLSDRNAEYGHGEADRLSRVLSIYLGYAYLFSFMMSQEEGTLTFAEQHEDNLFTPYNFTLLNRRIDSAKDNNTFNYYNYYLSVLCRLAASRLLQSIGNWKLTRLILLSRAEWLMHKEAQARFEIFRTITGDSSGYVNEINQILNLAKEVGMEEAVRLTDVESLISRLDQAEGDERISILQQIITLSEVKDKKLWAEACADLANVYVEFEGPMANKALELAIKYYEFALEFYQPDKNPQQWVNIKNCLGSVYDTRQMGTKLENIEIAIALYKETLVIPFDKLTPSEWAVTRHNLAVNYSKRLKGEGSENHEEMISYALAALKVYTPSYMPDRWASLQNLLGNAYSSRLLGEPSKNIEDSIFHYNEALKVYDPKRFRDNWAMVQNNLGIIYKKRLKGEKKANFQVAETCFLNVLAILNKKDNPLDWSDAIFNYGNLLLSAHWASENHFEKAISLFTQILSDDFKKNYPFQWASAQNSLGAVYVAMNPDNRENLLKAFSCFSDGISVITMDEYPRLYRNLCISIGGTLHELSDWTNSRRALENAVKATELIRGDSLHIESRRFIAQEMTIMFAKLVSCCLHLKDYSSALEYSVLPKNRALTELIRTDRQRSDSFEISPELNEASNQVKSLQKKLNELMLTELGEGSGQGGKQVAITNIRREEIIELRRQINAANEELFYRFPLFVNVPTLPLLATADIQQLLAELGGVTAVEYVNHADGWGAFIITPVSVSYCELKASLRSDLSAPLLSLVDDSFWTGETWRADLRHMYQILIAPLKPYLPEEGRLIVSPANLIHLVPFQALQDEQRNYLSDFYELQFVPEIGTLYILNEQRKKRSSEKRQWAEQSLLNIAYSGLGDDYLPNVLMEARIVKSFFKISKDLFEENADPENISKTLSEETFDVVHFSCHGRFNFDDPGSSGLSLANGTTLSIEDIRLRLRLNGSPLVTLSACQTGQLRPEMGEETAGLAWSFLMAGASAVISSQWSVSDHTTRELFQYFYNIRNHSKIGAASALRMAMLELRKKKIYAEMPFFWAALQVTGLDD